MGGSVETANDPRPTINPVISRCLAAEKERSRAVCRAARRLAAKVNAISLVTLATVRGAVMLFCTLCCVMLCCATSMRLYCVRDVRGLHDLAFEIIIIL